jgi:hypothetical protein
MTAARTEQENTGWIKRYAAPVLDYLIPLWDRLFALEPSRWTVGWITVAAGYGAGRSVHTPELFWHWAWSLKTFIFFAGITVVLAASGLLRQIIRESQDIPPGPDNHLPLLVSGKYTPLSLGWFMLAAGLLLLAPSGPLAVALGAALFFATGGTEVMFHLRESDFPVPRVAETILAGLFLLMLGWIEGAGYLAGFQDGLMPYFMGYLSISLLLLLTPLEPAGRSLAIERASVIGWIIIVGATTLAIGATVVGYLNRDPVISTAAMLILPFFAVALGYRRASDVTRTIRYAVILTAIFVGARYPAVLLVTTLNFYLCRFYFGRRYGLSYPPFAQEKS